LDEAEIHPQFESSSDSVTFWFLYKKKDFSLEIKNSTLKLRNEMGDDVTLKFTEKYK